MGRKHKRQYRAEKPTSNEPPLKLVLKVGKDGASSSIAIPQESVLPPEKDTDVEATPETGRRRRGRRKKKHVEEKSDVNTGSETVETGEATVEETTAEEEEPPAAVEPETGPAAEPEEVPEEEVPEMEKAEESIESDVNTGSETVETGETTAEETTAEEEPAAAPEPEPEPAAEPEEVAEEVPKEGVPETETAEEAAPDPGEEDKPETDTDKGASMPFKKLYLSQPPEKKKSPKASRGKEIKVRGLGLDEKDPLTKVLESLHTSLEKKDVDKFFAHPVTDLIAPGYSTIIAHPMDFSTMKKKIKDKRYLFIGQYQDDFLLMCKNCMTYNQPETIYFKAAKKLQAAGQKIMSKERLAAVKRAFHYTEDAKSIAKLRRQGRSEGSVGDASECDGSESMVTDDVMDEPTTTLGNPEGSDDLTDKEAQGVINEVLAAAKEARERLTTKIPESKMGFLRREQDGTTTLNFVNPSNIAHPYDKQAVNLGMLTSKLAHGTGSLPGFREDKRNKANPITYLYYGPFSSYAPQYDSTYSNLSKEESDLLYSTYGDELGNQYAQSIKAYTKDCDSYVTRMVDELLDILTHGEHSKTKAVIEENHKEKESNPDRSSNDEAAATSVNPDAVATTPTQPPPGFNLDSLMSLSDLGIDMSFLPTVVKDLKEQGVPLPEEPQDMGAQLDKTADLIQQLEKTQNQRLSQKPPPHLQYVPEPSEQEYSLADKLNNQLQSLITKVKPSDVVSSKAVRGAMGIVEHPPIYDQAPPETIEIPDDDPTESGPNKDLMDLLDSPQNETTKSPEVMEIS